MLFVSVIPFWVIGWGYIFGQVVLGSIHANDDVDVMAQRFCMCVWFAVSYLVPNVLELYVVVKYTPIFVFT